MPEQIDAVDADDVKKYLGSFIEDKFKEWAELEGAKLAALLEHLAEDVIAVTNENVAAASSGAGQPPRPADTQVDIDVDSFKYDVGVYAVGALGTTLFLFVNTLAGGLLTLAAPILAIVVKSKISGDIREQAKSRIAPVILRAAEAMGPHFDRCIDDFARHLREFVTSAGNTLYRGISEILDQTIAERRAGGAEVGGSARANAGATRCGYHHGRGAHRPARSNLGPTEGLRSPPSSTTVTPPRSPTSRPPRGKRATTSLRCRSGPASTAHR